jgi:hypothetical protein
VNLQFPVGRIRRQLQQYVVRPVAATAGKYLAATLEYLTARILKVTGSNGKRRITPSDIILAIQGDKEVMKIVSGTILAARRSYENFY